MQYVTEKQACRQVASRLLLEQNPQSGAELYTLCAEGLNELSSRYGYYRRNSVVSKNFFDEIEKNIQHFAAAAQLPDFDLQATAFMLFESLAVVFKETVKKLEVESDTLHKQFFDFFENCGEWQANDMTKVTQFYYSLR